MPSVDHDLRCSPDPMITQRPTRSGAAPRDTGIGRLPLPVGGRVALAALYPTELTWLLARSDPTGRAVRARTALVWTLDPRDETSVIRRRTSVAVLDQRLGQEPLPASDDVAGHRRALDGRSRPHGLVSGWGHLARTR